jgi:hypothetical protein
VLLAGTEEWPGGVGVMYQMRPDGEKPGPLYRAKVAYLSGFRNVNLAYPGFDYGFPVYILTL